MIKEKTISIGTNGQNHSPSKNHPNHSTGKKYKKYKDSGVEWLGVVPAHWDITRIKFLARSSNTLFIDGDWIESNVITEVGIRYITTGNVGEGIYREQGNGHISEETFTAQNCTEVFPGDLIISRLNSPIGRCCIVPDLGKRIVTSVDNVILRPGPHVLKKYLLFLFSSKGYFEHTELISRGATMQRISRGMLGNIKIPLPPKTEQKIISRFLEQKTIKIHTLISKKEKLIELLQEERIAIINQAVTKGLDPNAPMKDSGIEWLGEIPQNWTIKKLRYIGRCQNGVSGEADYFGSGLPFISYTDVYKNNVLPSQPSGLANSTPKDREVYSIEEGDILFTRTSETIEEIGLASTCMSSIKDAVFAGFLIRFRPVNCVLYKGFSKYYFRSHIQRIFFVKEMNLVTRASLSQELLKRLPVLIPNYEEQIRIAEFLDSMTETITNTIYKVQREIELLLEYKNALVSEVVAGKIDVRQEDFIES